MKRANAGWRRAAPTLVTAGLVALCVAAMPRFDVPAGLGVSAPDARAVNARSREVSANEAASQAANATGQQAANEAANQAANATGQQAANATATGQQAANATGQQAANATGQQAANEAGQQAANATTTANQAANDRSTAAQTIPDTRDYQIGAKGAVVIDATNGRVLFAQNANGRLAMASTTKIMTAMLTLEQDNPDEYFTVDSGAIHVEGSSMGLREGDSVSLAALAYGMLLPSGNDAANAAAVRIAGSLSAFARLMNERAAELGLEDTSFVTPSGLDDERHFSSAYDMALLAREAMENSRFAEICALSKAKIQFGNPPYDRWLSNHNRLLRECEGVIGVKTGFTDSAGRCLVTCAERGGVRLIVVTLGCPDDWSAHSKLYDRYFGLLQATDVTAALPKIDVPVTGGAAPSVTAVCDPENIALFAGENPEIIITAPPFLYAPVREGQVIGRIYIRSDGQPLGELTLTASTF